MKGARKGQAALAWLLALAALLAVAAGALQAARALHERVEEAADSLQARAKAGACVHALEALYLHPPAWRAAGPRAPVCVARGGRLAAAGAGGAARAPALARAVAVEAGPPLARRERHYR